MPDIIDWIAAEIMPHEPAARRWLRQLAHWRDDEDDLIQEAYCRLAKVANPAAILAPRAYLFSVIHNLMRERVRRDRIVRIESVAEIERLGILDDAAPADVRLGAREQLLLVQRLIDNLPPRCRSVFRLRRIEQLSQRQTAQQLGISENIVEKEVAKGLQIIMAALADLDRRHDARLLDYRETNDAQRRD